jgi:hypothetical protein
LRPGNPRAAATRSLEALILLGFYMVELVGIALLSAVDATYIIDSYSGEKGKKGGIAE